MNESDTPTLAASLFKTVVRLSITSRRRASKAKEFYCVFCDSKASTPQAVIHSAGCVIPRIEAYLEGRR